MKTNEDRLILIRKYAKLLDSQFTLPGTEKTFGLDPLLSFVPGLGSFSGLLTGSILIALSHKEGVSGKTKALMFKNLVIDFLFGLIPILGNIKDFFYKANNKNVKLIEEHLLEDKHHGSGIGIFIAMFLVLVAFLILSLAIFIWAIWFIIGLF